MSVKTTAVAAIAVPLIVVAAIATVAGAITAVPDTSMSGLTCAPSSGGTPAGADTTGASLAQRANAQTIAQVGVSMGVPEPGETIAIATALQESGLQNLDYGDRDSLGLFQQRPSQGWGTPAQILTPAYAAEQFYKQLLQVSGWRSMPTTEAAQAVQRSAFPDAYAKWQGEAQMLAAEYTGGFVCTQPGSGDNTTEVAAVNAADFQIPAGTPAPIVAVITFALAQLGKPYVYGATGPRSYDCSGLIQAAYAHLALPSRAPLTNRSKSAALSTAPRNCNPATCSSSPAPTEHPNHPDTSECTSATTSSSKPHRLATSSKLAH
jgi:cell wall-associated NlpC family hydrolase